MFTFALASERYVPLLCKVRFDAVLILVDDMLI